MGSNLGHPQSLRVPEVSRFFGIVIAIYHRDHPPPHFHAIYGEHEVTVNIKTGAVSGALPLRASRLVQEWRLLHGSELLFAWSLAQAGLPPLKIRPLE